MGKKSKKKKVKVSKEHMISLNKIKHVSERRKCIKGE